VVGFVFLNTGKLLEKRNQRKMNTQNMSGNIQMENKTFSKIRDRNLIIVLCAVICVVIAIFLWFYLSFKSPPSSITANQPSLQKQIADQVIKTLQNAKPATQQQINSVITSLSKSKPATATERQGVVSQLSKQ
jgi:uncharacterized protein YneF (UPF0154 family)